MPLDCDQELKKMFDTRVLPRHPGLKFLVSHVEARGNYFDFWQCDYRDKFADLHISVRERIQINRRDVHTKIQIGGRCIVDTTELRQTQN